MIRANDDEIIWLFYIKKARYVPKERSDQLLILYLRPAFFFSISTISNCLLPSQRRGFQHDGDSLVRSHEDQA
jgi:hypothetical protein